MATSKRASNRLYDWAGMASRALHRPRVQQVAPSAHLGRALESTGATTAQVLTILGGDRRAEERLLLRLGLAEPQSMYLFPADLVRQTKVRFRELMPPRDWERKRMSSVCHDITQGGKKEEVDQV